MSEKQRVGTVLPHDDTSIELGTRDAFHVPGVLVTSCQGLRPNDNVKFCDDACTEVVFAEGADVVEAKVDPFVNDWIKPGQKFWVFPLPELVGPVRHRFEIKGRELQDGPKVSRMDLEQALEAELIGKAAMATELNKTRAELEKVRDELAKAEAMNPIFDDDSCRGCYS